MPLKLVLNLQLSVLTERPQVAGEKSLTMQTCPHHDLQFFTDLRARLLILLVSDDPVNGFNVANARPQCPQVEVNDFPKKKIRIYFLSKATYDCDMSRWVFLCFYVMARMYIHLLVG